MFALLLHNAVSGMILNIIYNININIDINNSGKICLIRVTFDWRDCGICSKASWLNTIALLEN